MYVRALLAAFALVGATFVAPTTAVATSPAQSSVSAVSLSQDRVTCTKTSTGKCIKGGQFCPKAKRGKIGIDAKGKRWKCKATSSRTSNWKRP